MRTLRQEGARTSYMVLEARRSEYLPYAYHQGVADKGRRADKHRAVQEEDMRSY